MSIRTKIASTLDVWKVLIPEVGWRVVSKSGYSCPHCPGGAGSLGLHGWVSIKGKREKIRFIPEVPVITDGNGNTIADVPGTLRFEKVPHGYKIEPQVDSASAHDGSP